MATVAMMLPTAIFASEGEYTAPAEWATVTVSGDMWEQDVIITYTIPEGTDYSKINFPIFNSDENGFNLIDQNGNIVGRWTWQPSDSADITIRVIDETEKYTYQSDSLQVGTKDLDVNNPREVVNRSYNPALYSLIKIENTSGGANNDVEDYLTDEVLATLLVEASYENGIEDLDDFYCDYYNVDSLDQLDSTNLTGLFSGRYNGGFSGMYDAIGANEANSEVIEIGWKNLYTNLFTLNEIGLLNYRTGSEFLSSLDDTFATSVTSNNGVTVHVEIDGEKTTDCYQAHDIYFGLEFSMTQPEPEPEPSEPSSEPSSNRKSLRSLFQTMNPAFPSAKSGSKTPRKTAPTPSSSKSTTMKNSTTPSRSRKSTAGAPATTSPSAMKTTTGGSRKPTSPKAMRTTSTRPAITSSSLPTPTSASKKSPPRNPPSRP